MTDSSDRKDKQPLFRHAPVWISAGLLCAALWGSAPVAIKETYAAFRIDSAEISSMLLLAGLRFAFAGIFALILYSLKTRRWPRLPKEKALRVVGLALLQTTVHYAVYFVGIARTSGTHASILSAMQSFLLVLIAHFLIPDDRLTVRKSLAVLLGIGGVLLLNLGGSTVGSTVGGDLLVITATLMAAASSLVTRLLVRSIDAFLLAGWQLLIGGSLLSLIGLAAGGTLTPSPSGLLWFAYLVALSTVAFSLWGNLLKHHQASRVGIFMSLTPIFGTLLSKLILGEDALQPTTLLAALLVSSGVFLISSDRSAALK